MFTALLGNNNHVIHTNSHIWESLPTVVNLAHALSVSIMRYFNFNFGIKTLVALLVTSRLVYGYILYEMSVIWINYNMQCRIKLLGRTRRHEHMTPVLASLHWLPGKYRCLYKILIYSWPCYIVYSRINKRVWNIPSFTIKGQYRVLSIYSKEESVRRTTIWHGIIYYVNLGKVQHPIYKMSSHFNVL